MLAPHDVFSLTRIVIARRIGRIVFGSVLIAGALCLIEATVRGRLDRFEVNSYQVFAGSWLAAFALAGLARLATRRLRWARDPDFLLTASIAVPMVGIVLLFPLTTHMALWMLGSSWHTFNQWVQVSMVIAGSAHLAVVIAVILRARALVADRPAQRSGRIYGLAILVSCLPFIVLLLPPLIVAVTGLPLIPFLDRMETIVRRERAELALAPRVPPRAVVI